MNDKIYFPIKLHATKCRGNIYCIKVLKADTFEVIDVYTNNLGVMVGNTYVDLSNFSYNGDDTVKLSKNSKVLVYDDVKNDLYGVVSFIVHPQLWWVPKKNLSLADKSLINLLNYKTGILHNSLYTVDNSFCKYYAADVAGNFRLETLKYKEKASIGIKEFQEMFNLEPEIIVEHQSKVANNIEKKLDKEDTDDKIEGLVKEVAEEVEETTEAVAEIVEEITEVKEEATEAVEETTEAVVETTEKKSPDALKINNKSLNDIVKDLVSREIILSKREEEISNREELIQCKERDLREREVNIIKQENMTDGLITVEAEELSDNLNDMTNTPMDANAEIYTLIFKLMKKGDCISVPFDTFTKFTFIAKGVALEKNNAYTIYKQAAVIKPSKQSIEGVFAMVEANENNPVKVTVLNEYGLQNINKSDIVTYYNKYRALRIERSYI